MSWARVNHKLHRRKSVPSSLALSLVVVILLLFPVLPLALAQTLETTLTLSCTPKPPGQVGWWPGDGSGEDISGLANPGTLLNGVTFAAGKVDQAFSFDGLAAVVQIANEATFDFENTNPFTIDAWINTTPKGAGNQFIVAKQDVTISGRGYYMLIDELTFADTLTLILQHGSPANLIRVQGTTDIIDGQWHHVAGVYNGNGLASGVALYVDGVQEATVTIQDDLAGNTILNNVPLTIGTRQDNLGSVAFNGLIDEVEVFNTALTTSQIQAISGAGVAGKCRGGAVGVAVNPNTNRVFVTSASPTSTSKGAVSAIQDSVPPSLPTVLSGIAIFLGPALAQAAVNPNTNRLFVPSHASDSVFVVDVAPGSPTENTVVAIIAVGDAPSIVAVNTNTNRVYVTNSGEPFGTGNAVTVIQDAAPPALPSVETTLTVGTGPLGVAVNPATNHVFVANSGSGTVSVIQDNSPPTLPSELAGSPFSVGSAPGGLAVNPSTGHVFVTHNLVPGQVTVLQDGASVTVSDTLAVGNNPISAAVNTNTNRVFVNHFSSPGAVTVIQDGVAPTVSTAITLPGNSGAGIAVNTNTNRVYIPFFGTFGTPGNTVAVISDPSSAPADTTQPETSIVSAVDGNGVAVADGGVTSSSSITFTFTGTDDVAVASFECSSDGATFSACTSPHAITGLVENGHVFQVRALDTSGNADLTAAGLGWTVDTTPPAITSSSVTPSIVGVGSPATITITKTVTDNVGVAGVTATVQGLFSFPPTTIGIVSLSLVSGTPQSGTWSAQFTFLGAAPDAFYAIVNTVTDFAGNSVVQADGNVILIEDIQQNVLSAISNAVNDILAAISDAVNSILDAISDAVSDIIQAVNTRLSFFASSPGSVVGVNSPSEVTIFEMTNTVGMVSGYINADQLDVGDQLRVNTYIDITDNGVFDPVLFKGPAPIDGKAAVASAERVQVGPLPVQFGIRITVSGITGDVTNDTIFYQFFVERSGT